MTRKFISVLLLVFALTGREAKSTVNALGAGLQSCGDWLSDRAKGNYFEMGNWALGFISGVAIYSPSYHPLEGLDSDAVAYWLDDFWRAHPTAQLVDALRVFIREHPGR